MSEAIYVSPLHFGHMALVAKKRNSFNEVEEVDSEDIPIIHNNKRSRNEPSFSLNKFGENSVPQNLPIESVGTITTHQQHIEMICKSYQSQIDNMKLQHHLVIDNKNKEVAQLTILNQRLTDECRKISEEHKVLAEENKTLKRAVQIQDHKYKELAHQSNQYESVVKQAAEYIQRLEEMNRALSNELTRHQGQHSFFPPHNPPDVF